jgi:hypothetical protein
MGSENMGRERSKYMMGRPLAAGLGHGAKYAPLFLGERPVFRTHRICVCCGAKIYGNGAGDICPSCQ